MSWWGRCRHFLREQLYLNNGWCLEGIHAAHGALPLGLSDTPDRLVNSFTPDSSAPVPWNSTAGDPRYSRLVALTPTLGSWSAALGTLRYYRPIGPIGLTRSMENYPQGSQTGTSERRVHTPTPGSGNAEYPWGKVSCEHFISVWTETNQNTKLFRLSFC